MGTPATVFGAAFPTDITIAGHVRELRLDREDAPVAARYRDLEFGLVDASLVASGRIDWQISICIVGSQIFSYSLL